MDLEPKAETKERLISLTDYAAKYRIGVTTLRRRLRSGQMHHHFIGGKYYLIDRAPFDMPDEIDPMVKPASRSSGSPSEALLETTTQLLHELKQSYALILQEKEEQIVLLKDEIADLKTLIRVLEAQSL